ARPRRVSSALERRSAGGGGRAGGLGAPRARPSAGPCGVSGAVASRAMRSAALSRLDGRAPSGDGRREYVTQTAASMSTASAESPTRQYGKRLGQRLTLTDSGEPVRGESAPTDELPNDESLNGELPT